VLEIEGQACVFGEALEEAALQSQGEFGESV